MKKLFLIVLGISLMISCSAPDRSSSKNEELIKKYVKAVEEKDTATMEALLADDYEGYGPSVNDKINKEDAVKSWKKNASDLYESIHYSKSRILSVNIPDGENKGEWVSNWAELKIVYKKDKKTVTIWANTVYKIENSKIIKTYTFYNEADVLEQLGYVFINPNDL